MLTYVPISSSDLEQFKKIIYLRLQMTDELFSALGLTTDINIEKQLFSSIKTNLPSDYEVSYTTPLSDDFGIFDSQLNVTNPTDCYTDLTSSPQSSWNDYSITNTPTSSGAPFFIHKYTITI